MNYSLDLAKAKKIDAINFGPFNKTSLKLGGCKFDDELHHMADKLNVKSEIDQVKVQTDLKDLLGNMEDSSSEESSDSSNSDSSDSFFFL